MPLKSGFGYNVFHDNMHMLLREGHKRPEAAAIAFAHARVSFFRAHPKGALPEWLAFPTAYRLREHYDAGGRPVMDIRGRVLSNPRTTQPNGKEMRAAVRLHEGFTGRRAQGARRIKLPKQPRAGVVLGTLIQVGYVSERDGQPYRHTFRAVRSRPLLIASSDGKQVLIVGGRFAVTDRGIEDKA